MSPVARTAVLGVGIAFCIVLAAMTIAVFVDLDVERWTFSYILLAAFLVGAVIVIGMILIALISALRNPPDE